MFDDTKPIFLQLAERLSDEILRGVYAEGEQVPSTNELSAHLRINPATAGKALTLLVEREILIKRRGIGMFVAEGAKASIARERSQDFVQDFVRPLLAEAQALGLDRGALMSLIDAELGASNGSSPRATAAQPTATNSTDSETTV